MDLFASYASDADEQASPSGDSSSSTPGVASDDSYFRASDDESVDSATQRQRQAAALLRDLGEPDGASGPAAALLPGANDALQSIAGRPRFLDPEATRPLAAPIHRGRGAAPISPQPDGNEEADGGKRKRSKGAGWDIASMAPKLKKGQRPEDEHGPPAGAVISAAAKRYKTDDRVDSGMVTAAQIAMLGGQWKPNAEDDELPQGRPEAEMVLRQQYD
ncbi:hypothetical protein WJX84_010284 [Apatococcus fuscideae]|uniref:Uncharacterized protein n=1 Tax=Apatococcus fuscideae TaxID=2026836 RepID=A0AAW1SRN1_9CHLO